MILDDTTLDKPYAEEIEVITYHWSGKHHRVVKGINLITLLRTDTDGNRKPHLPVGFRVYARHLDGSTKNDHARSLWAEAESRGLEPECVLFDSWYASLENLKQLRRLGWRWLTQLKSNRLVNPDGKGNRQISTLSIPEEGIVVHLRGYGWVKVFQRRRATRDGSLRMEYWATNDLDLNRDGCEEYSGMVWRIEDYHRGLKQCCGVERSQVRFARGQVRHIGLAIRAFLRLEWHRLRTGLSWYKAKKGIIWEAIRTYLANPIFTLAPTA
jgi:putative transposase